MGTGTDGGRGAPAGGAGDEAARSGRASAAVGSGILLSRVSGVVREAVVARALGTTFAADAFKAALWIPNLIQNLLGEGVLSASFIPVLSRLVDERDERRARELAAAVAGLLVAAALLLTALVIAFAGPLVALVAPGFQEPRLIDLTVTLVRIMAVGTFLQVLAAWCLGVLNSHRAFFLSYVAPVAWNAAQVVVAVALGIAGATGADLATAIAVGVVVGAAAQLAVQVPAVWRHLPGARPTLRVRSTGADEVVRRFWPALLGRGVVQISGFLDLVLASLLATGAVAALSYAQLLYLLPISLFAMSVAAAELPELSREADDVARLRRRTVVGLQRILFFVAFTAATYVVLGSAVVGTLFQGGEFGPADTTVVWLTLAAYSLGLPATAVSRFTQNTLYARGDVRGPARIAVVRVVVSGVVGAVLMFQLDRLVVGPAGGLSAITGWAELPVAPTPLPEDLRAEPVARLGAVGLALGSAAGAWVEYRLLRRRVTAELGWAPPVASVLGRLSPAVAVALAEGLGVALVLSWVGWWVQLEGLLVVGAAGLTYLAAARLLRIPTAWDVLVPLRALSRRATGGGAGAGRGRHPGPDG